MYKATIVIVLFICLLSCAPSKLVNYQPNPLGGAAPEKALEVALLNQIDRPTPSKVEVTEEKIQIYTYNRTYKTTPRPKIDIIFYNSVGSIKLYKKVNYAVVIKDKSNHLIYKAVYPNEMDAKALIDALYAVMNSS